MILVTPLLHLAQISPSAIYTSNLVYSNLPFLSINLALVVNLRTEILKSECEFASLFNFLVHAPGDPPSLATCIYYPLCLATHKHHPLFLSTHVYHPLLLETYIYITPCA